MNDKYRAKVAKKLGAASGKNSMKPVFRGGEIKGTSDFLQPVVEEGALAQLREKYLGKESPNSSLKSSLVLQDLDAEALAQIGSLTGTHQK